MVKGVRSFFSIRSRDDTNNEKTPSSVSPSPSATKGTPPTVATADIVNLDSNNNPSPIVSSIHGTNHMESKLMSNEAENLLRKIA